MRISDWSSDVCSSDLAREAGKALRKRLRELEAEATRLTGQRDAIDAAMSDPARAPAHLAAQSMGELMKRRATIQERIDAAEADWLTASEALEGERSEERRVGKEGVRTCRSRWSP